MSIFKEPQKRPVRDIQLKIVVNPQEKAAIDALADRLNMTLSELVRAALNEYAAKRSKSKK